MSALRFLHMELRAAMVRVNAFLLWDEQSGEAMVIDPGGEPGRIAEELASRRLKLKYIVLTHGHFDHIMATAELKGMTGAAVCMNRRDEPFITDSELNAINFSKLSPMTPFAVDRYLSDGEHLELGGESVAVLETPGHTPGEISLYIEGHLFCGDTVLRGTTGRMDLAGADRLLAARSLREKVFTLPEDTVIHCGHNGESSVAYEKANNDTARATV